ncbi:MAG TPA: amino acid ABC transporter permease [Acidimicrobiales bacterium]|nr:amino acid ABC transporter permease [Acidimicrobiales bacterium]
MEIATGTLAEPIVAPEPEPPLRDLTPAQWVRANLASTPLNALLTVVVGVIAAWAAYQLARWVFVTGDWAVVRVNLKLFMVGFYPADQLWRLWAAGYVVVAAVAFAGGALSVAVRRPIDATAGVAARDGGGDDGGGAREGRGRRDVGARTGRGRRIVGALHRFWPAVLGVVAILSFTRTPLPTIGIVGALVLGGVAAAAGARTPDRLRRWSPLVAVVGLVVSLQIVLGGGEQTGWDDWGGLHLVVSATVAGIALAFPLGLLLALGRRSSLPAIRIASTGYIEAFRAVPLVTLLFLGQYMIGFMFPNTIEPPSFLVRAVIAITLFEAAYIAEIVRGGLQAVPRGQVEAAQAIGLSPIGVMRLVVLPQALRAVIPAMVGQFISLFKDTSLLAIVGFFELIEVSDAVTKQDAFRGQGLRPLALAFVGLIYWAGCSTMSRESQRLERRLGVGER